MTDYLNQVKTGGRGKGKVQLIAYLKGKPIGRKGAIEAKCYDCMGHYVEGVYDCEDLECPLYPFNPNAKKVSKNRGFCEE